MGENIFNTLKSVERRACEKICLAGLSERENHSLVWTFLYFAHVSVGTCFVLGSHRSNIAVLFFGNWRWRRNWRSLVTNQIVVNPCASTAQPVANSWEVWMERFQKRQVCQGRGILVWLVWYYGQKSSEIVWIIYQGSVSSRVSAYRGFIDMILFMKVETTWWSDFSYLWIPEWIWQRFSLNNRHCWK